MPKIPKLVPMGDDHKKYEGLREIFETHEVTRFEYVYTGGIEMMFIRFQMPKHVKLKCLEVLYKDNRVLYIDGDWGHAIYELSDPALITRFNDMNAMYFKGKCEAKGEYADEHASNIHLVGLQEAMKWLDKNQPGWLT